MASYTGNLNLKKPALDDDALITDINNNMDILDAAVNGIQDGLAIVANGNTHVAITSGQFVYVRNHGTLTEGLYVASTNIAANATLSTSNLTADAAGGLNALNSKLTRTTGTPTAAQYVTLTNCSVEKYGDVCFLHGYAEVDIYGNSVILNVPSEFRPSTTRNMSVYVAYNLGDRRAWPIAMKADGDLQLGIGSGAVRDSLSIELSWIL